MTFDKWYAKYGSKEPGAYEAAKEAWGTDDSNIQRVFDMQFSMLAMQTWSMAIANAITQRGIDIDEAKAAAEISFSAFIKRFATPGSYSKEIWK